MTEAAIQTGQNAAAAAGQAQAAGAASSQNAATGANGSSPSAAAHDTPWFHATFTDPAVRQAIHTGGFKSADEFGKAYVETKSLVGRKGVIVPGEQATPEERAAALRQFGAPEKPEGYAFKYPEGYAPTETDKAYEGAMRKAMHEAGAPAWLAEKLVATHMEHVGKVMGDMKAAQAAELAAGEEAIKAWESDLRTRGQDPAKAKALAQQAFKTILPPDSPLAARLEQALADPAKGGSGAAALVDLFHRVGTMISEGGGVLKASGGGANFGPLNAEQAKAEITKVREAAARDAKHPYVDPGHPEHNAMQKRVMELYAIAYPGMVQES